MAGKHISTKKRRIAPFVVILAVAALAATIGGTMAWLTDSHDGITNTFTPASLGGQVVEEFTDKITKKNVAVQNTGDVAVYVRVALVPTWVDENGKPVAEPCDLDALQIKETTASTSVAGDQFKPAETSKWVKRSDGYFYYKEPVAGKSQTEILFVEAVVNENVSGPTGCRMNLQVMMQMVQAEPATAINQAWGIALDTDGNPVFSN